MYHIRHLCHPGKPSGVTASLLDEARFVRGIPLATLLRDTCSIALFIVYYAHKHSGIEGKI
ncbi:hypothetical protein KTT_18260 [Tengunoibacter tsumagoiensis]|uniref:Uncharacterized protein n=1 Tax=Tengunoibacter tsumagoiensis TaxID=2014871 RepID=A0A401ZYQ1_9CHLR|nr:hypothetical protein KTT_18260 [Tengunoibacter tsumagoiensis]